MRDRASLAAVIIIPFLLLRPPLQARAQTANSDHETPLEKLLDKPSNEVFRDLAKPGDSDKGMYDYVTCVYYPAFTVKHTGSGRGMDAMSVTPAQGASRPKCGKQDDSGERLIRLPRVNLAFVGAKGNFLFSVSTAGNLFAIFSAATRDHLYDDEMVGDDGIKMVSLNGDTLTIRYLRQVETPCLFVNGDQTCWSKTIQAAHLPSSIASQPTPTALCQHAYQEALRGSNYALKPTDRGYVGYEATVEITRSGKSTVVSRGAVSACGLSE